MKVINHTCKFCGTPIALKIDDGYSELGDPFNLIPLACCNGCAKLRIKRRVLNQAFIKIAAELIKMRKADRASLKPQIDKLTSMYVEMVNEWMKTTLDWDPEITDVILDDPENVGKTLARIWPQKTPA